MKTEEYMQPIWSGNIVHEESIMYIQGQDGVVSAAPLLYIPEKILEVRSSDQKVTYEEGKDYILNGGYLFRTEESRIPCWGYEEFYPPHGTEVPIASLAEAGRYIRYDRGDIYAAHQVCVTYTHQDRWRGPIPEGQLYRLPGLSEKWKQKEPVTIVYLGDSIMEGCDASGHWKVPPYMPILSEILTRMLHHKYGCPIEGVNRAVGGKTAEWGERQVEERILPYKPDLVILGFGMNDGVHPRKYEEQIEQIIASTRRNLPRTEFLLVSTMLPNPDGAGWTRYQPEYVWSLRHLASGYPGVGVADMTGMSAYLLSRKRFEDMTGNGINHPNDFLVRIYAQTILACLTQD